MQNSRDPMRPIELRAQREFTELVLQRSGHSFEWSPGDEPPDLWLTVSGRRIAVKVGSSGTGVGE